MPTKCSALIVLLTLMLVPVLAAAQDVLPADVAALEVVDAMAFDLLAGPMSTSAYLSPDGTRIAYFDGRQFCLLEAAAGDEQVCSPEAQGDVLTALDTETVRLSPDGRWLVFTTDGLRLNMDNDIWVMDTTDGALVNVTDDQYDGAIIGAGDATTSYDFDTAPCWTPDNRIAFIRYAGGIGGEAAIVLVSPEGGDMEMVGVIAGSVPVQSYALACAPSGTQFAYNYDGRADERMAGVWMMDVATGAARQVYHTEPALTPLSLAFSPDEQYILSIDRRREGVRMTYQPNDSGVRVIAVESGEQTLIDPDRYVLGAGWLPRGHALAYLVRDPLEDATNGVYVTADASESGRQVYAGMVSPHTSMLRQPLVWSANNSLLVSRAPERGIVVLIFE